MGKNFQYGRYDDSLCFIGKNLNFKYLYHESRNIYKANCISKIKLHLIFYSRFIYIHKSETRIN